MSDPSNLTKSFGLYDENNSLKSFGFLGILMAEVALTSDGVNCYAQVMTKYQLITDLGQISN